MHIELVVFDLAGTTMIDDGGVVGEHLAATIERAGGCVENEDVLAAMGLSKRHALELLLTRAGLDAGVDAVERAYLDFERGIVAHYRGVAVDEVFGVSRAFGRLKAMGIAVAIDTGFTRPIAQPLLDRLGWTARGLVDAVVVSGEGARGRPHPDMIFEAMRRTGVIDEELVVKVGDTPADLMQGTAAGCSLVVGVTNGTHREVELRASPHTHLLPTASLVPELIARIADAPLTRIAAEPGAVAASGGFVRRARSEERFRRNRPA